MRITYHTSYGVAMISHVSDKPISALAAVLLLTLQTVPLEDGEGLRPRSKVRYWGRTHRRTLVPGREILAFAAMKGERWNARKGQE